MGQCSQKFRKCRGLSSPLRADDPNEALDAARRLDEASASDLNPTELNYFERDLSELNDLMMVRPADQSRSPFIFRSGATYVGDWRGSAREGFGVQRWPDGATFAGQWKDNAAEGVGRFMHANGDSYVGEWKSNLAHGHGIYYHKDLTKYEGEWVSDRQEGFGVETWGEGSKYSGLFRGGDKEGWGVYTFPDCSRYVGTFLRGSFNGFGFYTGADGRTFRGSWHDSARHGIGRYTWVDGRQYCGQYFLNKKHGFGVYKWPDGRKYEGFWADDAEHGQGKAVNPDGSAIYARWRAGEVPASARSTSSKAEGLARWQENRATPRSARGSPRIDLVGRSGSSLTDSQPTSTDLKKQPSELTASTQDQSNPEDCGFKQVLAPMPEESESDDLEEESHGYLTVSRPGRQKATSKDSPARETVKGQGIGRSANTYETA